MASIGPTGQILENEGGDITESELYDVFFESGKGLIKADIVLLETFSSVMEAEIAVKALKDATGLPVIATFSFTKGINGYKTMMGVTPKRAAEMAMENGLATIGANCGNGINEMIEIAAEFNKIVPPTLPVMIQANAGMPELIENGARIIGGCCGTTPEHIAAFFNFSKLLGKRY